MGTDLFTYFSFVGNFRFVAKWDRRCRSSGTYDLQWTSEVGASCGTEPLSLWHLLLSPGRECQNEFYCGPPSCCGRIAWCGETPHTWCQCCGCVGGMRVKVYLILIHHHSYVIYDLSTHYVCG